MPPPRAHHATPPQHPSDGAAPPRALGFADAADISGRTRLMRSGSQSPPTAQTFRCRVSRQDGTAIVRAIGELDLATVHILDDQLAALRDAGYRRLILDLRNLAFIDSAGLHCILRYDSQARQDGFSIELVQGPPAVRRIFEITGTNAHLPFTHA